MRMTIKMLMKIIIVIETLCIKKLFETLWKNLFQIENTFKLEPKRIACRCYLT